MNTRIAIIYEILMISSRMFHLLFDQWEVQYQLLIFKNQNRITNIANLWFLFNCLFFFVVKAAKPVLICAVFLAVLITTYKNITLICTIPIYGIFFFCFDFLNGTRKVFSIVSPIIMRIRIIGSVVRSFDKATTTDAESHLLEQ